MSPHEALTRTLEALDRELAPLHLRLGDLMGPPYRQASASQLARLREQLFPVLDQLPQLVEEARRLMKETP